MDHFYITLPSNSSEDFYGQQPLCSFKTHLAQSLELNVDEWEVGLAEIVYPHNWKNVTDGKFCLKYVQGSEWVWVETEIPPALYETPDSLINTLNEKTQEIIPDSQHDDIKFFYNHLFRKFTAYVSASGHMVHFPKQMAITLGLGEKETTLRQSNDEAHFGITDDNRLVYDNNKIVAQHTLDLNRGLHNSLSTVILYNTN